MTPIDWDRRIQRATDLETVYPAAAEMLSFYRRIAGFQKQVYLLAPPDLATLASLIPELERLADRGQSLAPRQLEAFWSGEPLDPAETFLARALLEPYAARLDGCPWCNRKPQAAILRPEGYGAKRSLVCALCSAEWPFPRLQCPACGEREFDKLCAYTAAGFEYIRIDACETCRTYLKTIDLTKNGLADPLVDELAAIPLDLWAAEHGYTKLQPNLLAL